MRSGPLSRKLLPRRQQLKSPARGEMPPTVAATRLQRRLPQRLKISKPLEVRPSEDVRVASQRSNKRRIPISRTLIKNLLASLAAGASAMRTAPRLTIRIKGPGQRRKSSPPAREVNVKTAADVMLTNLVSRTDVRHHLPKSSRRTIAEDLLQTSTTWVVRFLEETGE